MRRLRSEPGRRNCGIHRRAQWHRDERELDGARWPVAAEAAAYGRDHLSSASGCIWIWANGRSGTGPGCRCTKLCRRTTLRVARAIEDQLAAFRRLVGRDPTHFDSHQHVHQASPYDPSSSAWARSSACPVRHYAPGSPTAVSSTDRRRRASLPRRHQHRRTSPDAGRLPRRRDGARAATRGGRRHRLDVPRERGREVETLCHPRVRTALDELAIELRSFRTAADGRP